MTARTLLAFTVIAVCSNLGLAHAQLGQPYLNLGVSQQTLTETPEELSLTAVTARGGLRLLDFVGAEIEGAIGVAADDLDFGVPLIDNPELALDYQVGGFLVGTLPVFPAIDLFARGGATTASYTLDVPEDEALSEEFAPTGVAYGAGVIVEMFGLGARAGYTRYSGEDGDFEATSNVFDAALVLEF